MKWLLWLGAVLVGLAAIGKRNQGPSDAPEDTGDGLSDPVNILTDAVDAVTEGVQTVVDTITAKPPDLPAALNPATDRIAVAIAAAEGFNVPGSVPNRNHNPGDLRLDVNGKGVGKDELGFIKYATDEDGWDALRHQVSLMLNNKSHVYNNGMTIHQVAQKYTATAQAEWASIVASALGVSVDTPLSMI